jgi:hypothetical protein
LRRSGQTVRIGQVRHRVYWLIVLQPVCGIPILGREVMKIRCARAGRLLKPNGFVARRTSGLVRHCAFVRPDQNPSLYQQIDLSFVGRNGEAVTAHISASVARWIRVKGLCVSRLLGEIAMDQDRGWSIIATKAEAHDWEQSLAHLGPPAVTEFASEVGAALVERTEEARQVARERLARLHPEEGVSNQIADLERAMPSALVAEARRLAAWPGVMQVSGAEEIYILACLSVLNGEDRRPLVDQDPLADDELMGRIQLVADGILSWDANRIASEQKGRASKGVKSRS